MMGRYQDYFHTGVSGILVGKGESSRATGVEEFSFEGFLCEGGVWSAAAPNTCPAPSKIVYFQSASCSEPHITHLTLVS